MKLRIPFISALALLAACGSNNGAYDASGVFETTEVIVSAKGSGEIIRFDAQEGQEVTAQMLLGTIDTTQLHLRKQQLVASKGSVRSRRTDVATQVAAIRQQIATQKQEKQRFENLVQMNAANQKQVDDIDAQIRVLERQLAAQTQTLQNANTGISDESSSLDIQIAQIEDQIRNAVIQSPISGVILAKYAEAGEYASPGKALLKVADIQAMFLRAYITASQLTELKIGQQVKVYADMGESGRREYPGTVTWISDKAEFTPKTIQPRDERANLVYAVKIAVENDGYIKQGMYGEVQLTSNN